MAGFQNAKDAITKDPKAFGVYYPLLNKLDLPTFEICKNAEKLAKSLVRKWLKRYMFKGDPKAISKAARVTRNLSSHKDRLSHGRSITIDVLKDKLNLPVLDLRDHPALRDLFTELWEEVEWFVENSDTAKFFENAHGVSFRRRFQTQQQISLQIPQVIPIQPPQQPSQQPPEKTQEPPQT